MAKHPQTKGLVRWESNGTIAGGMADTNSHGDPGFSRRFQGFVRKPGTMVSGLELEGKNSWPFFISQVSIFRKVPPLKFHMDPNSQMILPFL